MSASEVLRLDRITYDAHRIRIDYSLGSLPFATSIWYETVDLERLAQRLGRLPFRSLLFHIALFELDKAVSLRPQRLDLGDYASLLSSDLWTLWQTVVNRAWAQWRFENDDPTYRGPALPEPVDAVPIPLVRRRDEHAAHYLLMCGGGKDSLVAMKLMSQLPSVSYDTLGYSSSVYGCGEPQHDLIEQLTAHRGTRRHHRLWVTEDLETSPVLRVRPELRVKAIRSAETPFSVFAALPVAIAHDHAGLVVAHEHSANVPSLVWDVTGEPVNHQWGKSLAAEQLIGSYITRHIGDIDYFSVLSPLTDPLIFNALRRWPAAVRDTHSCNVRKPWCGRCAKCAYVWVNYLAYLPRSVGADVITHENLFSVAELQPTWCRLLGLGGHRPFECVGTIDETRLAFLLCQRKGCSGAAMSMFRRNVPEPDPDSVRRLTRLRPAGWRAPRWLQAELAPRLGALQEAAEAYIGPLVGTASAAPVPPPRSFAGIRPRS